MSVFIPFAPFPTNGFSGTSNTMPLFTGPYGSASLPPPPVGKGYNPGRTPLYPGGFIPVAPLPGALFVGGSFAM